MPNGVSKVQKSMISIEGWKKLYSARSHGRSWRENGSKNRMEGGLLVRDVEAESTGSGNSLGKAGKSEVESRMPSAFQLSLLVPHRVRKA